MPFLTGKTLNNCTWQAFERGVLRLLLHQGYQGVRLVGQVSDGGADAIAHRNGKRWLFQMKQWRKPVGLQVIDETRSAMSRYRANIPVVVALYGFDSNVRQQQQVLMREGIPLQLWGQPELLARASQLPEHVPGVRTPRSYQEDPIHSIVNAFDSSIVNKALIVMATGLGKTFAAAEAIRRINAIRPVRTLVLAHTNEIVYQLERAFWPFLKVNQTTLVWNGLERPPLEQIQQTDFVFACVDTVAGFIAQTGELLNFDVVVIDECHHAGAAMYESILLDTRAGDKNGPFLLGMTATPWRPDEKDITLWFGPPVATVDIVTGLKKGFLTNVDYRLYTDNINWKALADLHGSSFTPRKINRTLFITEWDDAVVYELQKVWHEVNNPRAVVFCGTIDQAITMRDRINALGFCYAQALYSQTQAGCAMAPYERNRILCDFHDGEVNTVCAVDILNEGVDVPDINIIVFQRVTHSRRIFVQQLGRGLRISHNKDKVIVLDFVSDIRRFAAGLQLKDSLGIAAGPAPGSPVTISISNKVSFKRVGEEDPDSERFLRQWLEDIAAIESAGEDTVLSFPPELPGGHQ